MQTEQTDQTVTAPAARRPVVNQPHSQRVRMHWAAERDKGFTLIELLVVIIIIGILAGIAIPVFLNQRKKGQIASVKADLRHAATLMEANATAAGYPSAIPADMKNSPGVTLTLKGASPLSANDQEFLQFAAACAAAVPECVFYNQGGVPTLKMTYVYNGNNMSGQHLAGQRIDSTLLAAVGWPNTGLLRVPTAMVSAAPTGPGPFCIEGTHSGVAGETWKWDSGNGGLAKGTCP